MAEKNEGSRSIEDAHVGHGKARLARDAREQLEGERRHLTVMFTDMVDSTRLVGLVGDKTWAEKGAEGGDGSSMTRTIPMDLVRSGEVLVAYGQNGEMLRPENGYPLRLVPGTRAELPGPKGRTGRVVLAHEGEFAVGADAEHRQARRHLAHRRPLLGE